MRTVLISWLDPRRSLAARLVWVVVLFSLSLSLLIGTTMSNAAAAATERETGTQFSEFAQHLADQLDDNINSHLQNAIVLAELITLRSANPNGQRELLERIQSTYPEYAWIGIANVQGEVIAATDKLFEATNASSSAWFIHGKAAPYVGDMHDDESLAQQLPLQAGQPSQRFLDIATPIKDDHNQVVGVLGAHLRWDWIRDVEQTTLAPLHPRQTTEALIIGQDGRVLLGPTALLDTQLDAALFDVAQDGGPNYETARWPDHVDYLSGFARGNGQGDFKGLNWTMLVRERSTAAFAIAEQTRWRSLLFGLGVGLLFAAIGIWLMHRISRPLNLIANAAERIQHNQDRPNVQDSEIPLFAGDDEIARVARSLNSLVHSLAARNHELQGMNATLEDRVLERTHEIERLSKENQRAAVTRERLRMARDLHDTLTHTLAGLLTQIRLTRKVAARNPDLLADELLRAETAAQQGLQDARAAIANLRTNPVSGQGLAHALEQRLSTFAQQQRLKATFETDAHLPTMLDDRAEVLYRIFEEVLRNIEKHAMATTVQASLCRDEGTRHIIMRVADDGIGFDTGLPREGHYGIRGMQEQCELIGAIFVVNSTPTQGTCVRVELASS